MNPSFSTRRAVLAAGAVAAAAALSAPGAGAITANEMIPHRQTVADVEAVSAAIVTWISDQVSLTPAGAPLGTAFDVADYPTISHAALEALLVPDYIAAIPVLDGWGNPYDYRLDLADPLGPNAALIRSSGEDGTYEGTIYVPGEFDTLASDLVWADGLLARRPGPPLTDYRTRQMRTAKRIRDTGVAILSWVTDQIGLVPKRGGRSGELGGTVDLSLFTPITHASLEALLVPSYMRFLSPTDGWGEPFDFYLDTGDLFGSELTAIRSRGRGGVAEGDVYTEGVFDGRSFDSDMVWADGVWVRVADLSKLIFFDDFETGDSRFWSASSR